MSTTTPDDSTCPVEVSQVCATDGETYDNACLVTELSNATVACGSPCPCATFRPSNASGASATTVVAILMVVIALAIAAGAAGRFFYLRHKKQRERKRTADNKDYANANASLTPPYLPGNVKVGAIGGGGNGGRLALPSMSPSSGSGSSAYTPSVEPAVDGSSSGGNGGNKRLSASSRGPGKKRLSDAYAERKGHYGHGHHQSRPSASVQESDASSFEQKHDTPTGTADNTLSSGGNGGAGGGKGGSRRQPYVHVRKSISKSHRDVEIVLRAFEPESQRDIPAFDHQS